MVVKIIKNFFKRIFSNIFKEKERDIVGFAIGFAFAIAALYGIKEAILKDGSPSCGVTYVYSNGVRVPGRGVTAEALNRNGIKVKNVDSL